MTTVRKYFGRDNLDEEIAGYVTQPKGFFVELGANSGIASEVANNYDLVAKLSRHPRTHDLLFRVKECQAC